jgi:hypothetical protein
LSGHGEPRKDAPPLPKKAQWDVPIEPDYNTCRAQASTKRSGKEAVSYQLSAVSQSEKQNAIVAPSQEVSLNGQCSSARRIIRSNQSSAISVQLLW